MKLMIALLFSHLLNQGCVKIVLPGTAYLQNFTDQAGLVVLHARIRLQAQHKMRPGQNGFRKIGIELDVQRRNGLHQYLFNPPA